MPTPEELRRRLLLLLGLPSYAEATEGRPPQPLPPAPPRNPFEEYLGPLPVPTGTTKKPPEQPIYGPNDPRSRNLATAKTIPPGLQKVADILSPPGSASRKVFSLLGALSTAEPGRDVAAELQQANPIEKVMMGLPVGAPVGSLLGGVSKPRQIPGVVEAVGRAGVQKAAPVARRLATEEAGAIRLSPESEKSLRNLKPAQKPGQIKAIQESTALSAEEKAARLKIIEEGPITTPVASEALGPAAKAAQATEGVSPAWETGTIRPFRFDSNSTVNQGRFRLLPPEKGGSYITRQSGTPGVSYIVDTKRNAIQALRFNKEVMPEAKAAEWWEANQARLGREAPVGARTAVSESVQQATERPVQAPTGVMAAAEPVLLPGSAVPPTVPPIKPPVTTGAVPPVEPVLPRPRTLADMNREAKGMRAMTPEQRAAVMDVAQPIEGDILYQARPFNEHAQNLLGADTGFNKALRSVPGVKQLFGAWNPAAMARDNPVAMIGLRQGIFQEIEKSRVRFATLRWWNDADDAFGFKRSGTLYGLKPTSGVWKATKVKAASPDVVKGKMFGTINDIIEHPERYALDEAQKSVLALADNTLTQSVRDAQRAGVNVVELAEAYWPRSVIRGLKGEKGFAGIRRRVSGAKGYTHQRVFADVDDLVKAGFEVETDPRRVFAARLEAGVDTIAQANARKQIAALPGVEKPLERMARKFPEVLESANQARAARDAAKVTVVKAGTKATPEQVVALRQAEADYITAMREVFAKKIEAGTPGYYELRLPSGRIAPRELVEEVGKFIDLPELRQGATGGAARMTQEVSQLLRTSLTNVDMAAGYIQGQALFYRNNVAWWKAQGTSVVSLIDDPTAFVAKNFDLIDEGVRAGAIVAPTEFLFAKQGIASIPLRIPYAGPALGSFNRAFEWFITAGQTELYRAARSGAFKNAGMDELVSLGSAIRKEVGTESYAILGVRPNQRTMEALTLFAARFFRANVGLLGQSFTRGPGGAEARKAVGSLIAGGVALTIGINWAQSKKLPNMTDPYAPDWMQFKINKTYFNAFGPMYGYFRTTARMSVALAEGDPMKAATEAKKFMQSKESLPLRAVDIGGQLIYYGSANVYGTKIEKNWASIVKGILSEFVTPISAQEIPSGFAEGRPEASLEFGGLVGRPVRWASEWANDLQPYTDIVPKKETDPVKQYAANQAAIKARATLRASNPDIDAKLFITGQVDSLGDPTRWASLAATVRLMKENSIRVEDVMPVWKAENPTRVRLRQTLKYMLGVPSAAPAPRSQPTPSVSQKPSEAARAYEDARRKVDEHLDRLRQSTPEPVGAR